MILFNFIIYPLGYRLLTSLLVRVVVLHEIFLDQIQAKPYVLL